MGDTKTILDGAFVRRRRAELGLSTRAVGAALGTSGSVVVRIESGDNHPDLTLGVITQLADLLGVNVADLFASSHTQDRADTSTDDVRALGSLLFAAESNTPAAALRDALGWTQVRTKATLTELATRLQDVGLLLSSVAYRHRIVRDATAANDEELASLVRAHVTRDGLNLTEASMLARIARGDAPRDPSNPETVAIRTLVNAGLVTLGQRPTSTAEVPLILSDEVRFSLLTDVLDANEISESRVESAH